MGSKTLMCLSDNVQNALANGRPVVALESTIIAHGMPFPENLETGRDLEDAIHRSGATPATIVILNGQVRVGVSDSELEYIARNGRKIRKVAQRDIPLCIAKGLDGATTVSATAHIASRTGIFCFATGGIGGVHRGVAATWDISADLSCLSKTPVMVVCAGAKIILDISKTLEVLETAGVPVMTLRQEDFPGFYLRKSGVRSPAIVQSPEEAAMIFAAGLRSKATKGLLLAVPVPQKYEADSKIVNDALKVALSEAQAEKIEGQQVTPFLLRRISELTGGPAVYTNRKLAVNNAIVAAKVSIHLCKLLPNGMIPRSRCTLSRLVAMSQPKVIVVGGISQDIYVNSSKISGLKEGESNIGKIVYSFGGVGRNVAETLQRLGVNTLLVSAVGADLAGNQALNYLESVHLSTDGIVRLESVRTASYCAVHAPDGDLKTAVADMDIFEEKSFVESEEFRRILQPPKQTKVLAVDGNLQPESMRLLMTSAKRSGVVTWFEPTSPTKAARIVQAEVLHHVDWLSPNVAELESIARALMANKNQPYRSRSPEVDADIVLKVGGAKRIILTQGALGVTLYRLCEDTAATRCEHFPAIKVNRVVNTTGAGDVLCGGIIACLVENQGKSLATAIRYGIKLASLAVTSERAVPPVLGSSAVSKL